MKETERITALFKDIYNEDPWIDVTLMGTLENISAESAAIKVTPQWNSVWEITNHIISWRAHELERVRGNTIISPADNYFTAIIDQSEQAWQNTLQGLKNSQQEWITFLETFEEEDLEKTDINNLPYYKHIHGIIQHDAYHLGQIVMLVKNMD